MLFVPFIELNNHLFGYALLQEELDNYFTWLFHTSLETMGGKKPVSILTYQDLAIKVVIARVFP